METGEEKAVLRGHESSDIHTRFSRDGKTLVSVSEDNTIRFWNVISHKEKHIISGYPDFTYGLVTRSDKGKSSLFVSVNSVNFFPDGKTLALGTFENGIRLFDLNTGLEKGILRGYNMSERNLILSPDGRVLAETNQTTIRLWDLASDSIYAILNGNEYLFHISFLDNGKTLWAGSHNGVRLWDLSFLYDSRPIEEKIREAEQAFDLELVDLEVRPIPPERNLYGVKPRPPKWPPTHPFHWLDKAEAGDAEAMVQLGIIYDRDNELEKAHFWYAKAVEAGSERGKERMKVFKRWLTLHQDNYPEAYRKYCLNLD